MLEKYFWLASATFFSAACGFTISRPCKGMGERYGGEAQASLLYKNHTCLSPQTLQQTQNCLQSLESPSVWEILTQWAWTSGLLASSDDTKLLSSFG